MASCDTVSACGNTVAENRRRWSQWDWSQLGEEWTDDVVNFRGIDPVAWKQALIEGFLERYIDKGCTALEIGPGGGRWTAHLIERAETLHVADIAQRCLDVCGERFRGRENLHLHRVGERGLSFLAPASIDRIWSYDVFVHINPLDTDAYLLDFARVLTPGGIAVIHHPDTYPSEADRHVGFRSNLTAAFFAELCHRHGLEVLEQDLSHTHFPGDCITVLRRPD